MHFSVRTVFQSEYVLNIFNMVGLQIRTLNIFTVFKKGIFAILIHFARRIHSAGDIYTLSMVDMQMQGLNMSLIVGK